MALIPRRNPLTSLLNFAADRDREANSIGSVISQIAGPALGQMGVKTEETAQPAVMRGPVPTAQPLGAMTGPAMAPTPVMSDEELKANVFPGESGGDYNALYGYANRPGQPFEGVNLTDMTVNEVIDFTDPSGPYGQWVRSTPSFQKTDAYKRGLTATPTGAFQVVGTTLKDAVKGLGLTGDEPYNEATQDAIGRWIFENQGPEAWEAWGKSGGAVSGGAGSSSLGGGAGADTLGGNSVEALLAQLYPQMSPEDEKRQRRKDLFAAASQGFSALSQGRPIDFSNIQATQENRKRQSVLDMRERERARAAASYVLANGGDPATATAMATGAISPSDFLTSRQLAKTQAEADKAKLLDGQRADLLAPILKDLGVPEDRIAEVVEYGKAGGDITEILTQQQAAAAADKLREQEADQLELAQTLLDSEDPTQKMVGQLVLQGGMSIKDATDAATKMFPQASGKGGYEFQARILQRMKAFGEDEATATQKVFEQDAAGSAGPMVTYNPDGSITLMPIAPTPAPAGVAPAQAAVTTAAPAAVGAPTGVAGAFNQQFGGMGTGIPTGAPAVAAQALPLDVAQDVATLESTIAQTAQRKQDLELALETAPDDIARAAIEADLAAVNLEQAQLNLQTAQSSVEPDAALKALSVQKAQEDLIAAELENEKRRRDAEGVEDATETEEQKAVRRQLRAQQSTDTVMREGTKLLDLTKDWKSGVVPGLVATGARLLSQSETGRAERLLAGIKDNIALDNLIAMKQDSPTGGALGSVSNAEGDRLENRFGSLDVTGNTTDLRDNVGAAMNAYNDAIHGTPAQILELYEAGEITAEQADAFSTRLVSSLDKDMATIMTENGPATNLGLSNNRDTIYGLASPMRVDEELGLTPEERDLYEQFK